MLHRVTWFAAAALAVVAVGTSIGYWGYDQKQQKEAFAREAETQYESSFHNLVNDVRDMRSELAKTMLTRDNHVFQTHLSDVSRLCYAAQSDLGRLPADVTPDSKLQNYLHQVSANVRGWIKDDEKASDLPAKKQLNTYYKESGTMISQLDDMQSQLGDEVGAWVNRNSAKKASLVADGMKKIDSHVASFAKDATEAPSAPTSKGSELLQKAPEISQHEAILRVASVSGQKATNGWTAKLNRQNKPAAYYSVSGTNGKGHISAEVTQHGGHLLTYYDDRDVTSAKYDYVQASADAKKWLAKQGFDHVVRRDAVQFDHTAIFTFAPTRQGVPIIGQPIQVHIALDNGQVIGFNAAKVYERPVGTIAKRKLTATQLKAKLSPDFDVKIATPVIIQNEHQVYVPAVEFCGTMKQDTFYVFLDARDGSEVKVDQLT